MNYCLGDILQICWNYLKLLILGFLPGLQKSCFCWTFPTFKESFDFLKTMFEILIPKTRRQKWGETQRMRKVSLLARCIKRGRSCMKKGTWTETLFHYFFANHQHHTLWANNVDFQRNSNAFVARLLTSLSYAKPNLCIFNSIK